ncbi:hypothetical protein [Nonomuraea cypriaca]|nr:hypothetical protein [Nonomuraea cypriaca]
MGFRPNSQGLPFAEDLEGLRALRVERVLLVHRGAGAELICR